MSENETNKSYEHIEEILKNDKRLKTETGELRTNLLHELVNNYDTKLFELLLSDEKIKNTFFIPVKDTFVFKHRAFKDFIDYNTSNNSYSKYLGKQIGLYVDDVPLADRGEVVLNFPFKDCVLEGGQRTEDGTDTYFEYDEKTKDFEKKQSKRREIFYNEILARDEIDQLFAPKAFCNAKKYDKDGEQQFTKFDRNADGTITDNLIIKGNNLLALHSLYQQFAGKVKLIYIDPPYNTGNDSFAYNNSFNHSTWLTFMKNRLEIARELLREDGVIMVQCDDNEQAYLKVLMDDVFGRENFIANSVRISKAGGGHDSQFLAIEYDYVLLTTKNKEKLALNKMLVDTDLDSKYKFLDEFSDKRGKYYLRDLDYIGSYSESLDYPIQINNEKIIYPGGKKGKPNTWRWSKKKVEWGIQNGFIVIDEKKEKIYIKQYQFVDNEDNLRVRKVPYRALINSINSEGAKEITKLFEDKLFNFPKPESFIKYLLDFSTQEGDLVLDYHLGSGTTAAVAHKMNRQYVGIEQMDYIETVAVERLKKVIEGEQGGISKSVNWQGGGEFVYLEMAQKNEQARKLINECESYDDLMTVFKELCKRYFLNYNFRINDFSNKTSKDDRFKALPPERRKEIFVQMLDLNQMWVNASEMNDKRFGLSEEDKKVTNDFYGE